jgi:hypothetical protein
LVTLLDVAIETLKLPLSLEMRINISNKNNIVCFMTKKLIFI